MATALGAVVSSWTATRHSRRRPREGKVLARWTHRRLIQQLPALPDTGAATRKVLGTGERHSLSGRPTRACPLPRPSLWARAKRWLSASCLILVSRTTRRRRWE